MVSSAEDYIDGRQQMGWTKVGVIVPELPKVAPSPCQTEFQRLSSHGPLRCLPEQGSGSLPGLNMCWEGIGAHARLHQTYGCSLIGRLLSKDETGRTDLSSLWDPAPYLKRCLVNSE